MAYTSMNNTTAIVMATDAKTLHSNLHAQGPAIAFSFMSLPGLLQVMRASGFLPPACLCSLLLVCCHGAF